LAAIDLPHILASVTELSQEITRQTGSVAWVSLLGRLLNIGGAVSTILGLALVAVGRRHKGSLHIVRAIIAVIITVISISIAGSSLDVARFNTVLAALNGNIDPAAALEQLLACINDQGMLLALIIGMIGTVLMAWPARQKNDPVNYPVAQQES
ncbi:MAG: hypothetical protein JXM68_12255, partial [Sedimentisphaerales bacterium]|nr:hypothetical protein [Sedimentisphaerales bacterium]